MLDLKRRGSRVRGLSLVLVNVHSFGIECLLLLFNWLFFFLLLRRECYFWLGFSVRRSRARWAVTLSIRRRIDLWRINLCPMMGWRTYSIDDLHRDRRWSLRSRSGEHGNRRPIKWGRKCTMSWRRGRGRGRGGSHSSLHRLYFALGGSKIINAAIAVA